MAVYFGKVCPWIRMIAIFASCFLVRNVDAFSLSMPVLYSGKEPGLTIVDVKSLNQTLFNQTYAVAFEFYNSWCGHCARFAPIWKQFAGDLRHWSSVVQVIALDCAVEENTSVCRQYEVEMYPSVRLFPPNVNGSQEHGHQLTELQPKAELLRNLTLRYLIDYQSKNLIKDWPVLQPIKSIDEWFTIKSFIKSRNASDIQVFLYVEPYDSLNGSQVSAKFKINLKSTDSFQFFPIHFKSDHFGNVKLQGQSAGVSY